jgi:hypothetical protein
MDINYNLIEDNLNNSSVLNKILLTYEVNLLGKYLKNYKFRDYSVDDLKSILVEEYGLDILEEIC